MNNTPTTPSATQGLAHSLRANLPAEARALRRHGPLLLLAYAFQYLHSLATRAAHYLHVPREPLYDLGFELLPTPSLLLDQVCAVLHAALIAGTALFMLSFLLRRPLFLFPTAPSPRVTTVGLLSRVAAASVLVQTLRIASFLSTTLPGPNDTCRPQSPLYAPPATLMEAAAAALSPWPAAWPGLAGSTPLTGCGDSVFSAQAVVYVLCALLVTRFWRVYPHGSAASGAASGAGAGVWYEGTRSGGTHDDNNSDSDGDMTHHHDNDGNNNGDITDDINGDFEEDDDDNDEEAVPATGTATGTGAGAVYNAYDGYDGGHSDGALATGAKTSGSRRNPARRRVPRVLPMGGARGSCSRGLGRAVPALAWAAAAAASMLLVVRRMHYSLDVVLAWTTTPLVWVIFDEHVPYT